jgi:hypothetical protein
MTIRIYRRGLFAIAILLFTGAALLAFVAPFDDLSRGGGRGMGYAFLGFKALFGEFVARYFFVLPLLLAGFSFLLLSFRARLHKQVEPDIKNADLDNQA